MGRGENPRQFIGIMPLYLRVLVLLLPNNFHQRALPAPSVKFTVENLLSGPKIKFALRNYDDDFPSHDLTCNQLIAPKFALAGLKVMPSGNLVGSGYEIGRIF